MGNNVADIVGFKLDPRNNYNKESKVVISDDNKTISFPIDKYHAVDT